jgi:hypothetical protein
MWQVLIGIFLVLHGLVHLLYLGQSARWFEMRPGLTWPAGSWAFSRLLGDKAAGKLAGGACVLAALGFVIGGIGVFVKQGFWHPAVAASAVLSALIFILLWDGGMDKLDAKGVFAVLINAAALAFLVILRWPEMGF